MRTNLSPEFEGTAEGETAKAILRKCVHCGFCTATCPTYQLLGDELDGPRGRIYLIKGVLEGDQPTRSTQQHLDRCLTCRNCETTCPSGVEYGRLVEIGRKIVDEKVQRPLGERAVRWLLREFLTSRLFKPALEVGKLVRPFMPTGLRNKIPKANSGAAKTWPVRAHDRKVMMLAGCVQQAMLPNINVATARVLDAAGLQVVLAAKATCCGAVRSHLSDEAGGLADARRNIDAWWPAIQSGQVEAVISNASACGLAIKEYGQALGHDPAYAEKASIVSSLTRDLSELLPEIVPALRGKLRKGTHSLAFHPPCTLQHGQKLRGNVEEQLSVLGFDVRTSAVDRHLCCGSAGTYSVLQPVLASALRDRKLLNLNASETEVIVSANVGCILHLQSGTPRRVAHWVEILSEALEA